ncbi:C3a anaphylatoxin chemotactic receptor-like [Engystomops pustulosus]|uniref:C3a anaphylatoxin chemotactic receptor-like n=1 Tax=Engystomops pustulosus TaxID=76066 RepID=UPI003AFA53B4
MESTYASSDVQRVSITVYSITFILGIIGNGLVIWIAGFRMKKTISSVWFLNLAIADFLCCLSLPVTIADQIMSYVCSSLSIIFFFLNNFMFHLNMSSSVLLLTAMSIDRWVSVMWPFWAKVHRTQKRVRITAGIIWVMSFIWIGIVFTFSFYPICIDCNLELILVLIRLFIMFVIPFLIIVTSYVTIFFKISNRPHRSQRPYRIVTAVILCFFLCWAPYYILIVAFFYQVSEVQHKILFTISSCFPYFNSCINPIIYVIMGQDFRNSFLRSIPFRVEKALSEHPDEPCEEPEAQEPPPSTDI